MQNLIYILVGKKGSGKTYMARRIVEDKQRLVVFDPQCQFSDCGVVLHTWADFVVYLYTNRGRNFRAVYQPHIPAMVSEPSEHDNFDVIRSEFRRMCWFVDTWYRDIWLMIDEIDKVLDPRTGDGFFKNMINRGRHTQINIVATTIRYTDTQRSLTAQADVIISFHTHEPADVRYFRGYFGDLAEQLPTLPPYHYIKYEKGQVSRHEPINPA